MEFMLLAVLFLGGLYLFARTRLLYRDLDELQKQQDELANGKVCNEMEKTTG